MLLLDEPLSALDKKLRAELQWELKALHSRVGVTFVYVTHDQDEALSMSDEVAILREGRLVQAGAIAAAGERVLIALRPEKLALSRAEPTSANRVAGRLADWSYFGTAIQLRVRVEGIGELLAVHPAWKSDIPLEANAAVWLGWDADAAIRVAED